MNVSLSIRALQGVLENCMDVSGGFRESPVRSESVKKISATFHEFHEVLEAFQRCPVP